MLSGIRGMMPTVLVSGATNGLGAAFVKEYLQKTNYSVIAIDKVPVNEDSSSVERFAVDVTSESSVNALIDEIKDRPIDLLIHSAGVRGLVPHVEAEKPNDVAACETMNVMDVDTLSRTFNINAVGMFLLLRALLPNLRKAREPKVIIMSSRMGSIGNNQRPNNATGSAYAYRASKAASNAIVRSFAIDIPEVVFVMCHPGRAETSLVRCKEEGAIGAEESVNAMMLLIEKWGKGDSGNFYDRFGDTIEW